jgi:serine/threonine-protein kinase RsbT
MRARRPPGFRSEARVPVSEEADVAMARKCAREVARLAGLSEVQTEALATAVSEIARNILVHAGAGEVLFGTTGGGARHAVVVIARDHGPGIPDPEEALRDGYSSTGPLGLGLSSARRLVDDFTLFPTVGGGTTVILKKWSG